MTPTAPQPDVARFLPMTDVVLQQNTKKRPPPSMDPEKSQMEVDEEEYTKVQFSSTRAMMSAPSPVMPSMSSEALRRTVTSLMPSSLQRTVSKNVIPPTTSSNHGGVGSTTAATGILLGKPLQQIIDPLMSDDMIDIWNRNEAFNDDESIEMM